MAKPWWMRLDGLPPGTERGRSETLTPTTESPVIQRVDTVVREHLRDLRHPCELTRFAAHYRPGVRGALRTMLGGVPLEGFNPFRLGRWMATVLIGPVLAVGGVLEVVRPAQTGSERGTGGVLIAAGLVITYVVGCVLLRRGARYFVVP